MTNRETQRLRVLSWFDAKSLRSLARSSGYNREHLANIPDVKEWLASNWNYEVVRERVLIILDAAE